MMHIHKFLRCLFVVFLLSGTILTSVFGMESSIRLTQDASDTAEILYPLESRQQAAQFKHLLSELRCLVCQNQDLADSHAPLAKDLRDQVYAMVRAGKSDQEIMRYLTDRYGDFILFKPPLKPLTYLLWIGPFIFLLLGALIFLRTCQRSEKHV